MIDEKKTRLMTKLTIYAKHDGKEDIDMARYYKADYVRLEVIKTILGVTLGSVLILAIIAIYYSEFLLDNALFMNYKALGKVILGYYLALLTIYIGITVIAYSIKYTKSRERLSKFYRSLGKLKKLEEKEQRLREIEEEEREDMEE